jgi:hypothetical protein
MSQIKVDSITNTLNDGPVDFPQGLTGDASRLTLSPQIISFSPEQLATNVGVGTNITLTFDQPMQFSGVGTIRIRSGSASGTVIESFTCGVSTRATISGAQLIIDPTNDLNTSTRYYVTLPSVGIANTLGAFFKGTESYFFNTQDPQFSAQGGDYVYTLSNPASPTGFYKYHIFSSSGILTTTSPSIGSDLQFLMVGGGGGGGSATGTSIGGGGGGAGGLITRTGPTLSLSQGTYTITIGGGASAPSERGSLSKISSSPTVDILTAFGGGSGGENNTFPTRPGEPRAGAPGGSGGGSTGPNPSPTPGGVGTPGQGNSGGPSIQPAFGSGGGGGAGAVGGTGQGNPGIAGNGGNGLPNPAFNSSVLSGYVPIIPGPSLSSIGPSGFYGGGGGGVSFPPTTGPTPTPLGSGGSGGGGRGGLPPATSFPWGGQKFEPGGALTGGGGGGAVTPPSFNTPGGNGGSGVVMLRYAVPSL